MDDSKKIKNIFAIDATSIISDTEDDKTGEASVGYNYNLNTSLPELAFSLAGFLKVIDKDESVSKTIDGERSVGAAFISLLQAYYDRNE